MGQRVKVQEEKNMGNHKGKYHAKTNSPSKNGNQKCNQKKRKSTPRESRGMSSYPGQLGGRTVWERVDRT